MDEVFNIEYITSGIYDQVLKISRCKRKINDLVDSMRPKLKTMAGKIVKVTYKKGDMVVLQIIDGEVREGPAAFMYHIDTRSLTVDNSIETGPGLKETKGIVILNFVKSIEVTDLTTLEEVEQIQFTICLQKMTEQEKRGQG